MDSEEKSTVIEQDVQPADRQKYETLYEKHKENIYFRWGLTAVVVVVVCILAAQLITKLPVIYTTILSVMRTLAAVVYGLCIAYVLDPLVERVERLIDPRLVKKIKRPDISLKIARGTGIVVALLVLGLVVWALVALVLPQLVQSVVSIVNDLPQYYNTVSSWVMARVDDLEIAGLTEAVMDRGYEYLMNLLSDSVLPRLQSLVGALTSSIFSVVKGVINIIIGLIISIYLLAGKDRFLAQSKKLVYAVCGEKNGGAVCNVCTYANRVFGSFVGGKLVDSAIIGILCFIGMTVLKLPYALLVSVIIGCTNIIPVFGPFLGAIPSVLFLLVINPLNALTFAIFAVVLQQIDGNIIGPLIIGDATGVGSFWVVVAILIFGGLWGVPGMIVGVPLFAVIYKIISEAINHYLKKRGLSTVTERYLDPQYPPRENVEAWNPKTRKEKRKIRRELRALKKLEKLDKLHLLHHEPKDSADSENSEK